MLKKNVLIPRATVNVLHSRKHVWALKFSLQPVLLPAGYKLARFEHYVTYALLAISDCPRTAPDPPDYSGELHRMINKLLPSTEQRALQDVIGCHASVFEFARTGFLSSVPGSRMQHQSKTGHANSIRQKPYRVSPAERKIIHDQVEEILHKGVIRESSNTLAPPVVLVKITRMRADSASIIVD